MIDVLISPPCPICGEKDQWYPETEEHRQEIRRHLASLDGGDRYCLDCQQIVDAIRNDSTFKHRLVDMLMEGTFDE